MVFASFALGSEWTPMVRRLGRTATILISADRTTTIAPSYRPAITLMESSVTIL